MAKRSRGGRTEQLRNVLRDTARAIRTGMLAESEYFRPWPFNVPILFIN